MPQTTRLRGSSGWIDLEFVERERTPRELMALGIRLHLGGLSLSNTVRELEKCGVERSRKAVHDWVHKADLSPGEGAEPATVALDETVIRIDGQQYWLYAAVDPATNRFLHVRLYSARTAALTEMFLAELMQKHDVEDALFNSTRYLIEIEGGRGGKYELDLTPSTLLIRTKSSGYEEPLTYLELRAPEVAVDVEKESIGLKEIPKHLRKRLVKSVPVIAQNE